MATNRVRGYLDAVCVLACEIVAFAFFLRASSLLGTVDFSHPGKWLQTTSPDMALTALLRLLGLAVSGWLLLSTFLYAAATLSGKRGIIAKSRLITLPALRRVVDSLAAASVAASSIGSVAAVSGASPPPQPSAIVRPFEVARTMTSAVTKPPQVPSAPARVSSTAVGRHFPHPGRGRHPVTEAGRTAEQVSEVPSERNHFAGLPRGTKVVVVQPGDCLSVLAERHLGDWRLDSEIEALNYGRLQPDGRALVDDHWIYVGWVLVMPSNAVGTIVVGGGTARSPDHAGEPPGGVHGRELGATAAVPHSAGPDPKAKVPPTSRTAIRSATMPAATMPAATMPAATSCGDNGYNLDARNYDAHNRDEYNCDEYNCGGPDDVKWLGGHNRIAPRGRKRRPLRRARRNQARTLPTLRETTPADMKKTVPSNRPKGAILAKTQGQEMPPNG